MSNNLRGLSVGIVILLFLFIPALSFASETQGTITSPNSYAWGDNLGWVNFAASSSNVAVTDLGLTGYIWSQSYGWINLDPTNGGVMNDGEGDLSGYAWGEDVGWINFKGATINGSGQFTGTIGSETSTAGLISFDCTSCDVQTDWRPQSVRNGSGTNPVVSVSSGGGGGTGYYLPLPTSTAPTASTTSPIVGRAASCNNKVPCLEALLVQLETELQTLLQEAAAQGITIPGGASSSSFAFARNLMIGSKGADVDALQHYLNTHGFPVVSTSGYAGSLGYETQYFGAKTQAALAQFQKSVGIVPATGYFGPITRAYVNAHE